MKQSKLIEMVENTSNFSETYDLCGVIYDSKSHDFEFVRTNGGWNVSVIKVIKKTNGKEVEYVRSFVLKEFGETMTEAFKNAALRYLKK